MERFSSVDCRTRLLGAATVNSETRDDSLCILHRIRSELRQCAAPPTNNPHFNTNITTSYTQLPHSPAIPPPPRAEDAEVQREFLGLRGSGPEVTAPSPPSTDTSFQRQRHNSRNGWIFTFSLVLSSVPCRSKSPHTRLDLDLGVVQAVPH